MNRKLIQTAIDEATEYIQDVSELKGARPKRGGKVIRKLSKAFYDLHLLEKQLEWCHTFIDYVQINSNNIYNEACECADNLEND